MDYTTIIYEERDKVGRITLNRPEKLNAINDTMLRELDDLLRVKEPDLDVKVMVIKGAGRAFSAGEDLSGTEATELMLPDPTTSASIKDFIDAATRWNRRWEYIFNYLKPLITQVHGYCLGAGFYLAMVSDITIAAEDAVFGDPSLRMGRLTGLPLWTWFIPLKKAKELIYLGKQLDAWEAEELGLVNKVAPASELEAEVERYARALALSPGDGMVVGKENLNAQLEARGVGAAWRLLTEMQALNLAQMRYLPPTKFNFWETRRKKGLRAALKERDAPFSEL